MKITHVFSSQRSSVNATNKQEQSDSQKQKSKSYDTYTPSQQSPLLNYSVKEVQTMGNPNLLLPGNINKPNWHVIPTKGMDRPSQEELISQIKELAIRYARATSNQEEAFLNTHKNHLFAQWVSPVSPDRKALYEKAMKAIKKFEEEEPKHMYEMILVDYLNEMDDISMEHMGQTDRKAGGGISIQSSYSTRTGGYDYDVKMGGQTVMGSTNGHWYYSLTPAESLKKDEFYQIYWTAFDEEYEKVKKDQFY